MFTTNFPDLYICPLIFFRIALILLSSCSVRTKASSLRQLERELHHGRHPCQRRQRQPSCVRATHLSNPDHGRGWPYAAQTCITGPEYLTPLTAMKILRTVVFHYWDSQLVVKVWNNLDSLWIFNVMPVEISEIEAKGFP